MSLSVCIVVLSSLPLARADFWDDFSNNLATDLAPLLSLFGEKVTMQYLSESITVLDYFIFAMAPMGILTALVSAIRVCGSPSLRAFVGRAQEGAGNAEAELCSSTSRNVCELYNNGGIARVFGRPKILEVVHDPSNPSLDFEDTAGIYTFQDYIKTEKGKTSWKEIGARSDMESQSKDNDSGPFAPNLSLNVGIKRKPDAVFWGVAIFGAVLQVGVLVYAAIITYYLQWESENSSSVEYACPLTIIGTLLVCSGVFFCAYLVGDSTNEQVYCRASFTDNSTPQEGTETAVPALYWLQPGGQVLGDQTFDAFGYSDRDQPLQKYLISWKRRSEEQKRKIWEAVILTTTGFVMQFIGLRGIHPTASIAQLGAILVMSAARASLRMQRLKPQDNFLVDCPDEVVGYELDWLALCIGRDDIENELKRSRQELPHNSSEERRHYWEFCGKSKHISSRDRPSHELNAATKLLAYRTRLAKLTESIGLGPNQASSTRQFRDDMVKVKSVAKQLVQSLESAADLILSDTSSLGQTSKLWWELDCSVTTRIKSSKFRNISSLHGTMPVHIGLCQSGESSWKLIKPLEIEAILGLWVWSLVSDFSVETKDKYDDVRMSRAFEVPTRRIISTSTDYKDLQLWIDTRIPPFRKEIFTFEDAKFARPGGVSTKKWNALNTYEPLVTDTPQHSWSSNNVLLLRFFGWHNIDLSQTQDVHPGSVNSTLYTAFAGGLVPCCVQELFGSFIKSLLSGVSDIGRIDVQEAPSGFVLSNTVLSDLIQVFVHNGLGSEQDALSCILPTMFSQLRSPPVQIAFQIAIATLKKHRQSKHQEPKYWDSAEVLLRWSWNICKQPPREGEVRVRDYARLCAMTLGELYRSALMNVDSMEFGKRGIRWLLQERCGQSEACCKTIECYGTVSERLDNVSTVRKSCRNENVKDSAAALLSLPGGSTAMTDERDGADLIQFAGLGVAEAVLAYLALGVSPDYVATRTKSITALGSAAIWGKADVVDILIGWGASQYCRTTEGVLPIDLAVTRGHHIIVKSLLETFDPLLVSDCRETPTRGMTTLHIAAQEGDEETLRLLIDSSKFDLESRDDFGNTPLHRAALRGQEENVKLLVDRHKAGIEIENHDGYMPLCLAIQHGQEAIAKMFFDMYHVDPGYKDYWGYTFLHKAAGRNQEGIVKLLLDVYHVDPESRQNGGSTPLHFASRSSHSAVVKLLLDTYHVDSNSKDLDGRTPLHAAVQLGRKANAELLLGYNQVDRRSRDHERDTPLHGATTSPDGKITGRFIGPYTVDPDVQDKDGLTPLDFALERGDLDLIGFIAQVSSKESRAKALLRAKEKGDHNVFDLLA